MFENRFFNFYLKVVRRKKTLVKWLNTFAWNIKLTSFKQKYIILEKCTSLKWLYYVLYENCLNYCTSIKLRIIGKYIFFKFLMKIH